MSSDRYVLLTIHVSVDQMYVLNCFYTCRDPRQRPFVHAQAVDDMGDSANSQAALLNGNTFPETAGPLAGPLEGGKIIGFELTELLLLIPHRY